MTPATIHLVSALRGGNTSTVEAANILDTWLNDRLTGLVDVLTEIVRAVESQNPREIWEAAKLAQVEIDRMAVRA